MRDTTSSVPSLLQSPLSIPIVTPFQSGFLPLWAFR